MAQRLAADPLAATSGLTPRYLRQQQAAAALALASAAAAATAPADLPHAPRPVDAATADLRRRLADAGWRPRRTPLALGMLLSH